MGAAVFLGCVFTAFGPSFALFVFTVGADPLRVIALVAGMFFWLLSVLLSSALWFTAVQLTDQGDPKLQYLLLATGAALSVLLQELSRLTCYVLLKKAGEGLAASRRGDQRPLSPQQTAYGRVPPCVSPGLSGGLGVEWPHLSLSLPPAVCGLSFGMASGAFSLAGVLAASLGPGVPGIHGDSAHFFMVSALQALCAPLLHACWAVVLAEAWERRRPGAGLGVVAAHLLASGLVSAQ
ncbi:gamma-secretase subunit APH-1A-like isoform X3 [Lepisosteus oculatus]|uniref:gamma-secretase subunit APH-1A-like isoform X3 n=1 Tax=Lepisosteus oculatus TaxID=7918 RepID=UPI003712EB79